jgi:PAS domain S-box-containing protein
VFSVQVNRDRMVDRETDPGRATEYSMHARISSEQLVEIVDNASDGIITVNGGRKIVLFNRGAAMIFGYGPREIVGRSLDILFPSPHGAEREIGNDFAHSPLTSSFLRRQSGVFGLRKDGTEFPAEVSVTNVGTGRAMLSTSIVRDVTDRKRRETDRQQHEQQTRSRDEPAEAEPRAIADELRVRTEELKVTTEQLWHAAQLAGIGELAAGIAHELNNPLGTVSLRIEGLLAKTPADDPRRRLLEVIEGEVERMGDLVGNLLQFSRPSRNHVSTVDVCEEITKTIDLVSHQLRNRSIRAATIFARGVPLICADRQQLRQVFLNLFTNAADAMLDGGVLAPHVRVGELPGNIPAVVIEVNDTGSGIPANVLPKVFDPFFTTKEEGKGTGLGLALCKRIVEQHHGTLMIVSEVGRGTTVRVALPVNPETNVVSLLAE